MLKLYWNTKVQRPENPPQSLRRTSRRNKYRRDLIFGRCWNILKHKGTAARQPSAKSPQKQNQNPSPPVRRNKIRLSKIHLPPSAETKRSQYWSYPESSSPRPQKQKSEFWSKNTNGQKSEKKPVSKNGSAETPQKHRRNKKVRLADGPLQGRATRTHMQNPRRNKYRREIKNGLLKHEERAARPPSQKHP